MEKKYQIIYADPPWQYKVWSKKGNGRSAESHYKTMNIEDIINNPTYLARNEKKKSIEFIKKYVVDNEYVLVAVRVSYKDVYFARTMYVMSDEKVKKYFEHNYFYKF